MLPYQYHRVSLGSGTLRCSAVQTHKSVVATQADSIPNVPRLSGSLIQPLRSVEFPKIMLIVCLSCVWIRVGMIVKWVRLNLYRPGGRHGAHILTLTFFEARLRRLQAIDKRSEIGEVGEAATASCTSRNHYRNQKNSSPKPSQAKPSQANNEAAEDNSATTFQQPYWLPWRTYRLWLAGL